MPDARIASFSAARVFAVVASLVSGAFAAAGSTPALEILSAAGKGIAWDVSNDGSVVVGWLQLSAGGTSAFRWSAGTGFDTLVPSPASAWAVSADGSRVVGSGTGSLSIEFGWRWPTSQGIEKVPYPILTAPVHSALVGISANGLVAVGNRQYANGNPTRQAIRWIGSNVELLGTVDGRGGASYAYAANSDGSVIVGSGVTTGSQRRAFRWTAGSGMVGLGVLSGQSQPDTMVNSFAESVSGDGSVVVGSSGDLAFRWTATTGMTSLGTLPGATITEAYDVSADGSVIVGRSIGGPVLVGPNSFVHRQGVGMRNLRDILMEKGVDVTPWGFTVSAVSGDGRFVVGEAVRLATSESFPFRADISLPDPCLDDLDGDGAVGASDLGLLLLDFGPCVGCSSDLDGDSMVGGGDASLMLLGFGPCG